MSEQQHTPGPEREANACLIMLTALKEIELLDRGYVMPSDALDPSRIIEHQPGCNVLYMGAHAIRARTAIAKATTPTTNAAGR